MDITFNCGSCGQRIVIDEAGAGTNVECPKCGQYLTVPKAAGFTARSSTIEPLTVPKTYSAKSARVPVPPTVDQPSTTATTSPTSPNANTRPLSVAPDSEKGGRSTLSVGAQFIAWLFCFGVLMVGGFLFVSALAGATGAPQEAAAGAVFATVFIGAYVFARIVEKFCNLLDGK